MRHPLPPILIWDREPETLAAFVSAIRPFARAVSIAPTAAEAARLLGGPERPGLWLVDVRTLMREGEAGWTRLRQIAPEIPYAGITLLEPEIYLPWALRFRFLHVFLKNCSAPPEALALMLRCCVEPSAGFGLLSHLPNTLEMFSLSVETRQDKDFAVERAANEFATAGFDIHELYDVRLILEELLNNALFHAFRRPDGSEKYHMATFERLEPGESVKLDFGHAGPVMAFAVSDNAGTLTPETVLGKLERQASQQGLYDLSGRGLHIARMLSSALFINIEPGLRTQIIAIFREKDARDRPKPLLINYLEPRTWRALSRRLTVPANIPSPHAADHFHPISGETGPSPTPAGRGSATPFCEDEALTFDADFDMPEELD